VGLANLGYLGAQERRADPASGLIQMGERSYSPSLGGFISEDPVFGHLGVGASVDRYLYVWDNPLNRYDLNGRDVCVRVVAVGCGAAVLADSRTPGR
jgi:RHS repeat-associated protein